MKTLQPTFDPSKYAERAKRIFEEYKGPPWFVLPIVGPFSYFNYRRVIENAKRIHDLGKSENRSGLLIWGKGEPALPSQTKFGGKPFRPAGLPWPCGEHGQPLPFIAQLNFSTLPEHTYGKSLLLLFGEIVEDEVVEFHAEWHDLKDASEFQLGSPPKHFPWPGEVFHAEVADIDYYPDLASSKSLGLALREATGLGSIAWGLTPRGSMLLGWDGVAPAEDDEPKWIALIQSFNPYIATELAWLNADESTEDAQAHQRKNFCAESGPEGYPDRWFTIGDAGGLVIAVNHQGEVEVWTISH